MDNLQILSICISVATLVLAIIILVKMNKNQNLMGSKSAPLIKYPGPGKCIGPGPKMGFSDPCCNSLNDHLNPDGKPDIGSWGAQVGDYCVSTGLGSQACFNDCDVACEADSSCVQQCKQKICTGQ